MPKWSRRWPAKPVSVGSSPAVTSVQFHIHEILDERISPLFRRSSKSIEHLPSALGLCIPRIFDFQPSMLRIDARFSLTNDAFKVPLTNLLKQ